MSWNYRVVSEKTEDGEDIVAIHEVFYNSKGEIKAVSENPAYLAEEDMYYLEQTLEKMFEALRKDVLVMDEIKFTTDLD